MLRKRTGGLFGQVKTSEGFVELEEVSLRRRMFGSNKKKLTQNTKRVFFDKETEMGLHPVFI